MATAKKNNYGLIILPHIKGLKYYTYTHTVVGENTPFYVGIGTQYKKTSLFKRATHTKNRTKEWKDYLNDKDYVITIFSEYEIYKEAKLKEIDMIANLGRIMDGGVLVNKTKGGDGCEGYKHTPEYIQKLSNRMSGKNNHFYGKSLTKEFKKFLSRKFSGEGNNMFGRKNKKAKITYKLNDSGDIINTFLSLRDAALNEGISHTCIREAINLGTRANGFKWKYEDGNK